MSFGQYSYDSTGSATQVIGSAERYSSKRVKHVYKSDEIFHLWANGQDTQGIRGAGASISAPGDSGLYSYSTCIAVRTVDAFGRFAFIVSENTHSVTTSSHIHTALSAIPFDRAELTNVPDGEYYNTLQRLQNVYRVQTSRGYGVTDILDHARNADNMVDAIRNKITEALASRKPKKPRLLSEALSDRAYMAQYCEAFGVVTPFVIVPISDDELAAYTKELSDRKAREQAAYNERQTIIKAENDRMAAIYADDCKLIVPKWVAGEALTYQERNTMARWCPSTYLRIVGQDAFGDTVETSAGASFPVSHAVKGLQLVRAVMARGEEWKRNGHTCHLGHYQIDRITADGTVHAGCHVVPFASINRIAPELDAYRGGEQCDYQDVM